VSSVRGLVYGKDSALVIDSVYGLVPPEDMETKAKCTNGVAKVETQQSFRNGLVGILTLGIYTPWQIDVTCATPTQPSQEKAP
jgi:Bor protein